MNIVERIRAEDDYLIPYLLAWGGKGKPQPWGAATSFALEVAHGYGLIRGESDATLTAVGVEVVRHLAEACDSGRLPEGEDTRSGAECEASQSGAEGNRPASSTPIPSPEDT